MSHNIIFRNALEDDLEDLYFVEKKAWKDIAVTKEILRSRIERYPAGQFVAELNDRVIGSIYTQSIDCIDYLYDTTFAEHFKLHKSAGNVFQLIGVAVLDEYASMQVGQMLRNTALAFARESGKHMAVAMTRCISPSPTISSYWKKVLSADDPVLQFHVSAGAKIVGCVAGYRVEDRINFGHAVMIQYESLDGFESHCSLKNESLPLKPYLTHGEDVNESSQLIQLEELFSVINHLSGRSGQDSLALDESFADQPFMTMGLDSLAIMDLRGWLQNRLPHRSLSPTFLFDHPSPKKVLHFLSSGKVQPVKRRLLSIDRPMFNGEDIDYSLSKEEIVIAGLSCRFPGGASDPDKYFSLLLAGNDLTTPLPPTWSSVCVSPRVGMLEAVDADTFDPGFFGLSVAEAASMDPHQRLLLEVAHEALVDAGLLSAGAPFSSTKENDTNSVSHISSLEGLRIGVFVGQCNNEWMRTSSSAEFRSELVPYSSSALAMSSCANRISYIFGLHGPSMVVDTACSSSLAALHAARLSVLHGDCDIALVASADLLLSPFSLQLREASQMLSKSGINRSFGEGADGYVRGEGAAAIVIGTADTFMQNYRMPQENMYASLQATAVNQDGRSASFTAPNGLAQRDVILQALHEAGVRPDQVSFIESHGTGTALGDPIEVSSLCDVFLKSDRDAPLIVGSVKSNMGHLEGCAGLAGVVKAVLSLKNRLLPPTLHSRPLNPLVVETIHKYDQRTRNDRNMIFPEAIVKLEDTTICGISSFGSGGTNSHVILKAIPRIDQDIGIDSICSTAVATPMFALDKIPSNIGDPHLSVSQSLVSDKQLVLFAGQGRFRLSDFKRHWLGSQYFRDVLEDISRLSSLNIVHVMQNVGSDQVSINLMERHLLLFALQLSQWKQLQSESAVEQQWWFAGHSFGEFAVSIASGAISMNSAVQMIVKRAQLLERSRFDLGNGFGMLALRSSLALVQDSLAKYSSASEGKRDAIFIAAVNGEDSLVLSGRLESMQQFACEYLQLEGRVLDVDLPYHSDFILNAANEFASFVDHLIENDDALPFDCNFLSCVSGKVEHPYLLRTGNYWRMQMLSTVRLDKVLDSAMENAVSKLVDSGVDDSLGKLLKRSLAGSNSGLEVISLASNLLYGRGTGGRYSASYFARPLPWRHFQHNIGGCGRARTNSDVKCDHQSIQREIFSVLIEHLPQGESADFANFPWEVPLINLGLDSLAAVAVRNQLSARLGCLSFQLLQSDSGNDIFKRLSHGDIPLLRFRDEMDARPSQFQSSSSSKCSLLQRAMLYYCSLFPHRSSFIETFLWRGSGRIDVEAVQNAWLHIIENYPLLRCEFDPVALPVPVQTVVPMNELEEWFTYEEAEENFSNGLDDLIISSVKHQRKSLLRFVGAPLLKLHLLKYSSHWNLVLSVHHLLIDGVSMSHILKDFVSLYKLHVNGATFDSFRFNGTSDFDQYIQYESTLITEEMDTSISRYWQETVQKVSQLMKQNRTAQYPSSKSIQIDLDDNQVVRETRFYPEGFDAIRSLAEEQQVSQGAIYHALFAVFLLRRVDMFKNTLILDNNNGHCHLCYGSTVFGRLLPSSSHLQPHKIVGPLVNTVPIVLGVAMKDSFMQLVQLCEKTLQDVLYNGAMPLTQIMHWARVAGILSSNVNASLFDVLFDYQRNNWELGLGDQCFGRFECLLDRIGLPLSVRVLQGSESHSGNARSVTLTATSESSSFDRSTVRLLLQGYASLLTAFDGSQSTVAEVLALVPSYPLALLDWSERFPLCSNELSASKIYSRQFSVNQQISILKLKSILCLVLAPFTATRSSLLRVSGNLSLPDRMLWDDPQKDCEVLLRFHLEDDDRSNENYTRYKMRYLDGASGIFDKTISPKLIVVETLLHDESVYSQMIAESQQCPILFVFATLTNSLHVFIENIVPKEIVQRLFQSVSHSLQFGVVEYTSIESSFSISAPCYSSKKLNVPSYAESLCDYLYDENLNATALIAAEDSGEICSIQKQSLLYMSLQASIQLLPFLKLSPKPELIIAVIMEKGWEQVVGAMAILCVGAAYLPMDARSWPEQRVRQVLTMAGACALVSQESLVSSGSRLSWLPAVASELGLGLVLVGEAELRETQSLSQNALKSATSDVMETFSSLMSSSERKHQELAYLIYTSGSTGVPKGVRCHHHGALNTIRDLNDMFGVTERDRVLGLSSLSFDLSVYDIFGMLQSGGALVLPSPSSVSPPDPGHWYELLESAEVTIWNTVPAFMELLVAHCELEGKSLPRSLRLIFLSGDWIPLSLPQRIRQLRSTESSLSSSSSELRIISMGGATEASIWSNLYELEEAGLPAGWRSIPYGRPMRNQSMYILNDAMEHCPEWVTGVIYIGGVGVADGYHMNEERTRYQFVRHPVTDELLFRTGDLGRLRPGGLLEILGREDLQVKVNGFRIELGEIEKVLQSHESVNSAVVAVQNGALCGFVVLHAGRQYSTTEEEEALYRSLQQLCRAQLTEYMVPVHWAVLKEVPLSANGKVSRDKLPDITQTSSVPQTTSHNDSFIVSFVGEEVLNIIRKVLRMADNVTMNVHLSFFSLGGNSLSAIQLLFALRAELQAVINIPELFAQSSLASLIALVESRTDASAAHSAPVAVNTKYKIMQLWTSNSNKASSGCLVLFNPAGASGLCYMDFVNALSQINQDRISRVLVLDDGAVSEGTPFTFTSILEVAVHAVEVLQKHELTRDLLGREDHQLHLGGWSYGGVVAFEVAKRLCSTFHICPQGLYLFDAPLQGEVVSEVKSEVHTFESRKFSQNPGDEVSQRSSQHFAQCTDLLRQYHKHISRGLITTPPCNLNCKIVDFRPRELEDGSPIPEDTIRSNCDYLNEVCSGDLGTISTVVNGSHWTILEGDNAFHIATIVIDNAQ